MEQRTNSIDNYIFGTRTIILNHENINLDLYHDLISECDDLELVYARSNKHCTITDKIFMTPKHLKSIRLSEIHIKHILFLSKKIRVLYYCFRTDFGPILMHVLPKYLSKIIVDVGHKSHNKLPKYVRCIRVKYEYHSKNTLPKYLHASHLYDISNHQILFPKNLRHLKINCAHDTKILLPSRLDKLSIGIYGLNVMKEGVINEKKINMPECLTTFITGCTILGMSDNLTSGLKYLRLNQSGKFPINNCPNNLSSIMIYGDKCGKHSSLFKGYTIQAHDLTLQHDNYTIYMKCGHKRIRDKCLFDGWGWV